VSAADEFGTSFLGGPLGIIAGIARLPTFGKTSGYLVDTVDPATGIPYQGAGSVEPPPFFPDATFAATGTNPIGIPSPVADPVFSPTYTPEPKYGYPVPETAKQKAKRLDAKYKKDLEELRRKQAEARKQYRKPPGGGKGNDGLGQYGAIARACLSNPLLCVAGGVFYPTVIGNGTLTEAEQKAIARARKRSVFTKEPKMPANVVGKQKIPRLILAGDTPFAKLETPKAVKITAKRMKVETPKAVKITAKRMPLMLPSAAVPGFWTGLGKTVFAGVASRVDVTGLLLGLAQPKAKSQPVSTLTAVSPITDPLTLTQTTPVGSPLAGGSFGFAPPRSGSLQDQCRAFNKKRKPKRKCIRRDDCNRCVEFAPI
jgi:hypothetical protein